MKTLYVGNLPTDSSETEIRALFATQGAVHALTLIRDRRTGQPRGICFIDMDDLAAQRAIATLDHHPFGNRALRVNEVHGHSWQPPRRRHYHPPGRPLPE